MSGPGLLATNVVTYNSALHGGFLRGQSYQTIENSRSESLTNVVALEMLRKGDPEKAIEILVVGLDSAIYAHGLQLSLDVSPPWLASEIDIDPENKPMIRMAKYRNIYPSQQGNPEIKKQIESTFEHYLK